MTKYQCLHCDGLDIDEEGNAICTNSYYPDTIKKSVRGFDCLNFKEQERYNH